MERNAIPRRVPVLRLRQHGAVRLSVGAQVNIDPLESRIEQKSTERAKKLGMLVLKLNVKGQVGWPDRLYIYNGHVLFIEFKRLREKPRPIQQHIHDLLRAHHIDVRVVDDLIQAYEVLDEFSKLPPVRP